MIAGAVDTTDASQAATIATPTIPVLLASPTSTNPAILLVALGCLAYVQFRLGYKAFLYRSAGWAGRFSQCFFFSNLSCSGIVVRSCASVIADPVTQ